MSNVYEVCGIYEAVNGPAIFPIDIVEAVDVEQALEAVARKIVQLRPWSPVLKLYRVPFFKTGTKPWRDDEIEFVCDIPADPRETEIRWPGQHIIGLGILP